MLDMFHAQQQSAAFHESFMSLGSLAQGPTPDEIVLFML